MLLPTTADPRDVSGESIVGLIQQQQQQHGGGGEVLARSPADTVSDFAVLRRCVLGAEQQ